MLFIATVLFYTVYVLCGPIAISEADQNVEIGALMPSAVEMSIAGGTNEYGKQTIFLVNNIDFGTVSFIHPEAISNGDAFIENGFLKLESVLNIGIQFSGVNTVAVDLSKLPISSNPFAETYYSLSISRASVPVVIYTEPQFNRVSSFTSSSTVVLRMIYAIKQQQSGKIYDRFRLTASSF